MSDGNSMPFMHMWCAGYHNAIDPWLVGQTWMGCKWHCCCCHNCVGPSLPSAVGCRWQRLGQCGQKAISKVFGCRGRCQPTAIAWLACRHSMAAATIRPSSICAAPAAVGSTRYAGSSVSVSASVSMDVGLVEPGATSVISNYSWII